MQILKLFVTTIKLEKSLLVAVSLPLDSVHFIRMANLMIPPVKLFDVTCSTKFVIEIPHYFHIRRTTLTSISSKAN